MSTFRVEYAREDETRDEYIVVADDPPRRVGSMTLAQAARAVELLNSNGKFWACDERCSTLEPPAHIHYGRNVMLGVATLVRLASIA